MIAIAFLVGAGFGFCAAVTCGAVTAHLAMAENREPRERPYDHDCDNY